MASTPSDTRRGQEPLNALPALLSVGLVTLLVAASGTGGALTVPDTGATAAWVEEQAHDAWDTLPVPGPAGSASSEDSPCDNDIIPEQFQDLCGVVVGIVVGIGGSVGTDCEDPVLGVTDDGIVVCGQEIPLGGQPECKYPLHIDGSVVYVCGTPLDLGAVGRLVETCTGAHPVSGGNEVGEVCGIQVPGVPGLPGVTLPGTGLQDCLDEMRDCVPRVPQIPQLPEIPWPPEDEEMEMPDCRDTEISTEKVVVCGVTVPGGGGAVRIVLECLNEVLGPGVVAPASAGECGADLEIIQEPTVRAEARIDKLPGAPYACTGTHKTVSQGTVGGTVSGGVPFASASVSTSLSVSLLEQYDFSCSVALMGKAIGSGGYMRKVNTEAEINGNRFAFDSICTYIAFGCEVDNKLSAGTINGVGIAGPAGGGDPAWPLPTAVEFCPTDPTILWAINGLDQIDPPPSPTEPHKNLLGTVTDSDTWDCVTFGIHYIAVA